MNERKKFIDAYMAQEASLSALCRQFGISRKTGYQWVGRFLGSCELDDRSRRPKHSPRAVAAAVEDAIVAARRERPTWSPAKLRTALLNAHLGVELPSVSTLALIFHRNGLVIPRRRVKWKRSCRGYWQVYFGAQLLGHLSRRKTRLHFTRVEHLARTT